MTVQAAPALVAGAVPRPPNAATSMTAQLPRAYTVQRPFYLAGARVEVGAVVDLPLQLATELAYAGKVAAVVADAAPVADAEPVAADPVAAAVPAKRAPRQSAPGAAT
jgi:hypothetical protein